MTHVEEERCDLTELYVSQCAHCRQLPDPKPLLGSWLRARYAGRCAECDDYIRPGTYIRAVGDGYLCTDCGQDYENV